MNSNSFVAVPSSKVYAKVLHEAVAEANQRLRFGHYKCEYDFVRFLDQDIFCG